ncbi:uncharacterized protein METZ01_LOCUS497803, partial [marine metagenome]
LLAYYPLDSPDGGSDVSGNGNHATVNGATFGPDRLGMEGKAYRLDGDDYIQTPVDSNSLPISFSVWFKPEKITGELSIIDSDRGGSYGHSLIIGYFNRDGDYHVQYHDGHIDTGIQAVQDKWLHATVTFGEKIQLYLDGVLVTEEVYNKRAINGVNFRIGRHNTGDPQWFTGLVDEVRFYERILSAEEAFDLYQLEGSSLQKSSSFTLVPGTGDTDNSAFTIDGDSLKLAAPLDF